jgi:hypothetical protein
VRRDNGAQAIVEAECRDTIDNLALQIGLSEREWHNWLARDGDDIVRLATGEYRALHDLASNEPLDEAQEFLVPNTILSSWLGDGGSFGKWWVSWDSEMQFLQDRGFRVAASADGTAEDAAKELAALSNRKHLHGWYLYGHGDPNGYFGSSKDFKYGAEGDRRDRGPEKGKKGGSAATSYRFVGGRLSYGMAFATLNACFSAKATDHIMADSTSAFFEGAQGVLIPDNTWYAAAVWNHRLKHNLVWTPQIFVAKSFAPGAQETRE